MQLSPGEIAALGTAGCWMISALSFEAAGKRIGSLSLNMIRLVIAFGLLGLVSLFLRGEFFPTDATAHAWLWLSISGVIGFVIGDYTLFRAIIEIGPRLASLVMSSVPVWVALIGWALLGEQLRGPELAGIGLVVGGIGLAISDRPAKADRDPPSAFGVTLAVVGALGQAAGLVLSKYGMGDYDAFAATHIRVLAGIAGFALLITALRWWPHVVDATRDRIAMGYAGLGAVFGPFLGVALSLLAVQTARNSGVAAALMGTTPILLIPAVMIRGEQVGARGIVGALIAVGGATLLILW